MNRGKSQNTHPCQKSRVKHLSLCERCVGALFFILKGTPSNPVFDKILQCILLVNSCNGKGKSSYLDNKKELLSPQEEEKRGESFPLGSHGHPYYGCYPPIYKLWECKLFTETFIFMSISINVD